MGEEGFSSDSSLLYHVHPPTAIVKSEGLADVAGGAGAGPQPAAAAAALPHPGPARRAATWCWAASCWWPTTTSGSRSRRPTRRPACTGTPPATRPIYLRTGRPGSSRSTARSTRAAGDYVIVPRGHHSPLAARGRAAWTRWSIEASGHIRPPRRYLSQYGQFLEHAPYCERDLRGPEGPLLAEGEDVPVIVRNRAGLTRLTYAYHPFDVVGWDGCLYPYAFNIADFEPIVKRTHAPPPVHQTFEGPNFVICSFCPRPLDFDPEAVPIPYNHHNVDSDEMMYLRGRRLLGAQGLGRGHRLDHPASRPGSPTARSRARWRRSSGAWRRAATAPTRRRS